MIRNQAEFDLYPPAEFDGVFLWDFLRGAFGPTRSPMDLDAVVEYRGWFLVFETKAPGAPLPQGQRITLDALVRNPRITVIFCAKRPSEIIGWKVQTATGIVDHLGDAAALRLWCRACNEDKCARCGTVAD